MELSKVPLLALVDSKGAKLVDATRMLVSTRGSGVRNCRRTLLCLAVGQQSGKSNPVLIAKNNLSSSYVG